MKLLFDMTGLLFGCVERLPSLLGVLYPLTLTHVGNYHLLFYYKNIDSPGALCELVAPAVRRMVTSEDCASVTTSSEDTLPSGAVETG